MEEGKKNNLVSVIIPFYKGKDWLAEALESVDNQTYPCIEVIIINDGSDENITSLETMYPSFIFVKTVNSGAGAARNKGIELATGDYICFLDSDDIWLPNKIKNQISFMINEEVLWSHTGYIKFLDGNPNKTEIVTLDFSGDIIPKLFIYCPIATPCVMINNRILIENPEIRFSESINVGEDSYFWFKLSEKFNLGYLPQELTKVRIRGSNAAYNPLRQMEGKNYFYSLIKKRKDLFKSIFHYNIVLFGFYANHILYKIIKKLPINGKLKINLAYGFYLFPYLYLKLINKIFSL